MSASATGARLTSVTVIAVVREPTAWSRRIRAVTEYVPACVKSGVHWACRSCWLRWVKVAPNGRGPAKFVIGVVSDPRR